MKRVGRILSLVMLVIIGITNISFSSSVKKPSRPKNDNLYRDQYDEKLKASLKQKWQKRTNDTRLIMSDYDLKRVADFNADRRVAYTAVAFADAKHTLVFRIADGYQTDKTGMSRETAYARGEMPNVSAHYSAQAFDIFMIDGVEIAWQVSADPLKRAKAHQKIKEVIRFLFDQAKKDREMRFTQAMVYSQADVSPFEEDLNRHFGKSAERGQEGLWTNERMWDRIHIGY